MGASSNHQGRAYEYAWMNALYESLSEIRETKIIYNSSMEANQKSWNAMDAEIRELLKCSADSAVSAILELEPRMGEADGDELMLAFQRDDAGVHGDVRDIVIRRNEIDWEVGLSIKHNHEAVKHSRLSHCLDFGKEWFGRNCSDAYWNAVKPIFDHLAKEKRAGRKWDELSDKEDAVYVPLLRAFMDEIWRAYQADTAVPMRMVEYLIGTKDYYKVVSQDKKHMTLIYTFNMHNTLNQPGKVKISAIRVPNVQLPTELVALKQKTGSKTTVEMYMNNGWQLSFRLHNASSRVEPSLKFDIQFIGMPVSVFCIECRWNRQKEK